VAVRLHPAAGPAQKVAKLVAKLVKTVVAGQDPIAVATDQAPMAVVALQALLVPRKTNSTSLRTVLIILM